MRSRLLAGILSVSMLFSSIPVNAAELNAGNIYESAETSAQEDEETINTPDGDNSADAPSVDGESSDEDSAQDDAASDDGSNDSNADGDRADNSGSSTEDENNGDSSDEGNTTAPNTGDSNSGEITEGEDAGSEDSGADTDGTVEAEEPAEAEAAEGEAEEPDFDVTADDVTVLHMGDNPITLQGYVSGTGYTYYWLSFEAPKAGYYNFKIKDRSSNYSYNLSMYDNINGNYIDSYEYSYNRQSNYMSAGETLYFHAYAYNSDDVTLTLEIQELTAYTSAVKQDDGSYSFAAEDYTLSVLPRAGVNTVRVDAALEDPSENINDYSYNLVGFIREHGAAGDRYASGSPSLNKYDNYQNVINIQADSGKEYDLRFVLMNSQYDVLALFILDDVFKTETSDKAVVIYDTTATENSITMDLEAMQYGYCYYAPVDGSEDEKERYIDKGWKTYTFTGLRQETEYYFIFTNNSKKEVFETKASTAEASTTAEYTAVLKEDGYFIDIEAVVSGYEGTSNYAYLYYEYTNELGVQRRGSQYASIGQSESEATSLTINTSINITNEAFLAGKDYDIDLWIEYNDLTLTKHTVSIKPIPQAGFTADKLTFDITPQDNSETYVDYSIQVNDYAGNAGTITGAIYYRPHGSAEDYYSRDIVYSPNETQDPKQGTIYTNRYVDYDFILFLGGVRKEVTAHAGTKSVTLSKAADGKNEDNAFDIVRTFEVKSEDGSEALTGEYTLKLYRLLNGSYNTGLAYDVTLNTENGYRAEVKTASRAKLTPNTDYDLKWELRDASSNIVDILYERITTPKPHISIEPIEGESSHSTQKFNVTLAESDRANFIDDSSDNVVDSFGSFYVYGYIRKAGGNSYRYNNSYAYLSSNNEYSNSISFTGLDAETVYEISLRDSSNNDAAEYATYSFTTPADERAITITGVTSYLHRAELRYSITGVASSDNGYAVFYMREKGTGDDAWERVYSNYWNGGGTISGTAYIYTYNDKELKDGTTYECKIGFSSDSNPALSTLERITEYEFSTKEDGRTLSNLNVSASYTTADISAFLNGNEAGQGSYMHYFYRVKDTANWLGGYVTSTWQTSYNYSQKLTGLTPDTTYEYVLVVSDSSNCSSPDEITKEARKASTEFTTKKLDITLDFNADATKITNNQAVIDVAAKGTEEERLKLELSLSDGQSQSVTLKKSDGYKGEVTFTNLIGNTEYTITAVDISVLEGTSFVNLGVFDYDYKFKTAEAEIPTEIKLSADKIALNALYAGTGVTGKEYEGYVYQTLKAEAVPATAGADFKWSSSNDAVAAVSQSGIVTAKGAGSAVITVESVYDETIKAQCEVVVKDYVIGRGNGTDIEKLDNVNFNSYYSRYKNSYTEGIALYERTYDVTDGEKMTRLSDFTVTAVNPQTASWEDGKLYANNVGYSSFIFEKDGIKARLNIYVTTEGKGFGITGISAGSEDYPAVKQNDGSYVLAQDNYYWLDIEVSPYKYEADSSDFNYSSSNEEVATVSTYGLITAKKKGDVEITVTPKNRYTINDLPYSAVEEVKVTLHIKELPTQGYSSIFALSNVHKKIGDVKFPENWESGDWKWKYPDTPLVTNGVYTNNVYPFEAVYDGDDYYPCETTLSVYIGKITGVRVSDSTASYNQVVEVNGNGLVLNISPISQGSISSSDYVVNIPNVNGLTITESETTKGSFTITAQKKGSYTLKPEIKTSGENGKVLASTTYKIKAVEEKQAYTIEFSTVDTEGVAISSGNRINFETVEDKKDFTLNAVVKDRNGDPITTVITWSTTDKTVATAAAASKTDTHSAKVTAKGDGHTVITATAKDAAGVSAKVNLEIQDHSPRVDTNKVNVNIAYDYDGTYSYNARQYAYEAGGAVEIVPVYGEYLTNVELRDKGGSTASQNLKIESLGSYDYNNYNEYEYLVSPASDSLKKGTYNCDIYVKTSVGNEYTYPLKVSVIDKAPSVSAKMTNTINLFYKTTRGSITFKVSGGKGYVTNVTWDKASNNGFTISSSTVSQGSNLTVANKKLADTSLAKGTLSFKVSGYKKTYEVKNFAIKYNYKKPALTTKYTSNNIIPSLGQSKTSFYIYNKTEKRSMYYYPNDISTYYYNEIRINNSDDVKLDLDRSNYYWIYYDYTGNANSKKFSMTLDSLAWREPLKVDHTVKKIKPTAYLTKGQITFNTAALKSASSTAIRIKNVDNTDIASDIGAANFFSNIVISGSNAKAQKLLDDDLITIETDVDDTRVIYVDQNEAAFMKSSIPAGTYSYKITPYYNNPETGASTALNAVTLKVKVINKAVAAKISPSGNLDLTYGASYSSGPTEKKNYAVLVNPKFSNLPDGYSLESYSLTGEYSKYFNINYGNIRYGNKYAYHYYITISDNTSTRKLKAGQAYKLAIEYTFTNYSGEELKVKSNTFTIKTKQSAPKVTVTNNNQTLYAAADGVYRYYDLSVPSSYTISNASGGIDCNKDGINDISVSGGSTLTVRINDRDAVGATAKGKTYSIPVTVTLRGRDGIAKDVKVTIKVKVRK